MNRLLVLALVAVSVASVASADQHKVVKDADDKNVARVTVESCGG